jgi:hypothetical protein
MKKISFILALLFTGCYSTSVINNISPSAVNFDNIKKGTVAVYAGNMGVTYNIETGNQTFGDKKTSEIVSAVNKYFESYIPTIKIIRDATPLPRAYMGELNMNQEQEMNQFLDKVYSEYAFIISTVMQDLNTKYTYGISQNSFGMMTTFSMPEPDNKINIHFELWDVRNKALLLDYEVTGKGWINLNGTLERAVKYIEQNGSCE